jgi:hypothetical protein
LLAVAINATGLIFFLKYPLMLIFGAGGLMLAFVPFQDRPLETWIIAFLRSIYSPTIYIYKKMPDKDWISLMNSKSVGRDKSLDEAEEVSAPIKDTNKVKEFIESLPTVKLAESAEVEQKNNEEERTLIGKIGMSNNTNKLPDREVEVIETSDSEVKVDDWHDKKTDLNLKSNKEEATAKVVFGEIPKPDKPDVPNVVVGMVTSDEGKIIEGAIVEIQDSKGNPSRVLKTNPLGQFRTTTPLANGKYLIITEKQDFNFDKVEIELADKIVEPIKIKAII